MRSNSCTRPPPSLRLGLIPLAQTTFTEACYAQPHEGNSHIQADFLRPPPSSPPLGRHNVLEPTPRRPRRRGRTGRAHASRPSSPSLSALESSPLHMACALLCSASTPRSALRCRACCRYQFYTTFTMWPPEVRGDLRAGIKAKNQGDLELSERYLRRCVSRFPLPTYMLHLCSSPWRSMGMLTGHWRPHKHYHTPSLRLSRT